MTNRHASCTLAPPLSAVLGSLNVDLEAELNRYRRDRAVSPQPNDSDDLFADLEDPAFDLDAIEAAVQVTADMPPPVPRNRKLLAAMPSDPLGRPGSLLVTSAQVFEDLHRADSSSADSSRSLGESSLADASQGANPVAPTLLLSSYLDSSEKLIESLSEVPPMPEPVSTAFKPKRKTVSLLAGAILGLGGLVAGLGASYLMSNPQMAQRVIDGLKGRAGVVSTAPQKTFNPPGPDLSAEEFVDINIDSLSSLHMPQPVLNPQATPSGLSSGASSGASPGVSSDVSSGVSQALPASPSASAALPPIANQPNSTTQGGIQAAVIPANATYYVTVPFTTDQALLGIRQSVAEAFVRQFRVGSRVQLAAFDDLASAQQFIEDIKAQGITAQVYGPTNE
ncbi:MAG: hypothetical protein DCF15_02615 [Phormidesmis priestleyi]|uniref:SPOR domain-containing protein n=1 Tax=Phormidesmis priestleyi TaxID=268141 RepID=A0A2W4Y0D1_9CYAN|nr:MAG: hypothetical protein DCF15_02615 [Phormidesmis priestleyi]